MNVTAAKTALLLSLCFLVVYGGCNWITSQRTDVGTWYFAWERHIPFVPLMIVPYMSIDLFFVVAPFLCREKTELQLFAWRVSVAIVVAGIFFLAMPLRFAFARPAASGWLGTLFEAFRSFDQPYNLFPSLHITLRTLLADLYAHRTRGVVRLAIHVWFVLIGFSTVLTYQHHVMDVVGGFLLALGCFFLLRTSPLRLPVVKNLRVGGYYGLGAAIMLGLAVLTWPWGLLLLWPAVACGLVAAAYCGLGPGIFRKQAGRLPYSAGLLLAPVLLGHVVSLWHYRRQCQPWNAVTPRVLIGRQLRPVEAAAAVQQGVTAVLDLTAEFSEAPAFLATQYHNIPILDLTAPTPAQLRQAVEFITQQETHGLVYVHCKIGYSRSAAVLGAYLIASAQAHTSEEAMAHLWQVRPSIIIRPEVWQALRGFASQRSCTG